MLTKAIRRAMMLITSSLAFTSSLTIYRHWRRLGIVRPLDLAMCSMVLHLSMEGDNIMIDKDKVLEIFDGWRSDNINDSELLSELAIIYLKPLGQTIGTVVDNFSVKNNAGAETQIRLSYDFSTSTDADIKSWLCGNRRISAQRPMRSLSSAEIKALDGTVLNALDCGKKVKSDEEVKVEYKARFLASDNETQQQMIADLQAQMTVAENEV